MRGLLVALLLTLGVVNANAADKYINANVPLTDSYRTVVSWSVTSGTTYKFNALLLLDWSNGPDFSQDSIKSELRFAGTAVGQLVTDNRITVMRQPATSVLNAGPTGTAHPIRFSGTFKATGNGTLTVQMRHNSETATVQVRSGSVMTLEEITP